MSKICEVTYSVEKRCIKALVEVAAPLQRAAISGAIRSYINVIEGVDEQVFHHNHTTDAAMGIIPREPSRYEIYRNAK